jgi:uncharacterized protein Yka (UPF0111/DUF47 family)
MIRGIKAWATDQRSCAVAQLTTGPELTSVKKMSNTAASYRLFVTELSKSNWILERWSEPLGLFPFMSEKRRIIDTLGEQRLILPGLVNAALTANDRAKYYFTLLQAAASHAEHPEAAFSDLRHERVSCGITENNFDNGVMASRKLGDGRYEIPVAGEALRALWHEVEVMLQPFAGGRGVDLLGRFEQLKSASPADGNVLTAAQIETLASGNRDRGDSLHLLVMDAHKALNGLQREIAGETVDGASVYAIDPSDRPLIRAFMRGVRRTAALKLDHPGLGTTATRVGTRLVLQNDIGTTDAHVLVVHVEDRRVSLTYTDVHLQRLLFFQGLFRRYAVNWSDTVSRRDDAFEDGVYHMSVGSFAGEDDAKVEAYLEFLGSRLVFLIDWNRARKRLRALVSKGAALRLLTWAAEHEHGHMAFLKAGGEQLVYDALDFVVKGQVRFGERLDEILGAKEASEYLQFVLKACAESVTRGEPDSFIQDAVRAELFNYFRSGQQLMYDVAAEHAALVVEIAGGVRDSVIQVRTSGGGAALRRNAERAKEWERRADQLVNRARSAAKQRGSTEAFRAIVEAADDVADELEEATFRLTLIPSEPTAQPVPTDLQPLGELLVQAAQEYVKLVETARYVRRGGAREDMQDFLDATHRVMALEHETDGAQRDIEAALATGAEDFRVLHVLSETTKNLEQAADALMHCSLRVRDYVLGQVMAA